MMTVQEMNALKEAKKLAEQKRQLDSRTDYKGWILPVAIGRTGGVPNVGWEAHREGRASRYGGNELELQISIDKRP